MSIRETALNALTGGGYSRLQQDRARLAEAVRSYARLVESYNSWITERTKEDAEWQKLSQSNDSQNGLARVSKIGWARRAFRTDPFAKRAVLTKCEFCFGSGIDGPREKTTPSSEPQGEERQVNPAIEALLEVWNDRSNQAMFFSPKMQLKRSAQLLVDGDLFVMVTARSGQAIKVRRYGSLLVDHRVNDPDDADRPLYYAVRASDKQFDPEIGDYVTQPGTQRWLYYRDINNLDPAQDPLSGTVEAEPDVYLMQVSINTVEDGGFGESDLITSLKWLNAAKMLAEDQATISKATAALMNVLEAETTDEAALEGLRTSLQSATDSTTPAPPLAGGMNVLSSGVEMKVSRASTNASDAWQNSRIMRMPACIGFGFAMHWLGDPENANLATATAMELPIRKMLEAYQTLWLGVYRELLDFALRMRGYDPAEVRYDIPVPKLAEPEIGETADAIFSGEERGLITPLQAAQRLMDLLGFDDIPERLQEWMDDKQRRDSEEEERMAAQLQALDQRQEEDQDDPEAA